jgi:CBS domain-containing protein
VAGGCILVGVLTDRDIVTAAVANDMVLAAKHVEDVMTTDLVTVREDDSLIDLMRSMRQKGVRRVPVVGPQSELVGVVTMDDVLEILTEEMGLLVGAMDSQRARERTMRT